MSKGTAKEKRIIAFAYFHRYGWIVAMMICAAVWFEQIICIFSVGCITFSFWSFIGYKNKWKHIYCSFQDAYHQKMTPNSIQWHKIKKTRAGFHGCLRRSRKWIASINWSSRSQSPARMPYAVWTTHSAFMCWPVWRAEPDACCFS